MTWGIWQIFARALEFLKIETLVESFYQIKGRQNKGQSRKCMSWKFYRGVLCHDNEEWYKIWRGIDLLFQNWHGKFDEFWPEHSKVSKMCTLMGSFWTKYIIFEPRKYRGITFHDTEDWCKIWRKTDLWLGKWHEEFGKFLPEQSKVSKLGLWWDLFIQSRKGMSLKFTEGLCVMAMKNYA